MENRTVSILIVDDDRVDVMAVQRGLRAARIANPTYVARDGVEAMEMLRGTGGRERVPPPYIILLDLNMPRMGGHDFLTELRADPDLRKAVVFVLTTSRDEQDRTAAYDRNVAGYVVKEDAGSDFLRLVDMLDHYWRIVELP